MAFIALARGAEGDDETLGVVRAVTDPDNTEAEFAIVVRSDLKGQGLGHLLFDKLLRYLRGRGTQVLVGDVLRENAAMRALAQRFGLQASAPAPDDDALRFRLRLDTPAAAIARVEA
jgi:acetyltransferase